MSNLKAYIFAATIAVLSSSATLALAESPTYKAGPVVGKRGSFSTIVMNDDGIGVIVEGSTKKSTQKAADAKADDLNAAANDDNGGGDGDGGSTAKP